MPDQIPPQPLQKIAMTLSGGGYRAASFHLGAMSYLNRIRIGTKPLLENVKILSTVSGGTITGAVYAVQKQEGRDFYDIYHFLLDALSGLDLVKMAIEKLNPHGIWNNGHKRKNLINAFAELYDQYFTGGKTFASFDNMTSHLEAVVFNSTEFANAVNFRFRSRGLPIFGNNYFRIDPDAAAEVKVADALAASSCFTAGFEPIIWPNDFMHDRAPKLRAIADRYSPDGVGLMDGGIYDNQGIESIISYKDSGTEPYFDLVIVSDVTSPYMKPYKPNVEQPGAEADATSLKKIIEKYKRKNLLISFWLLVPGALLALLPFSWGYNNNLFTGACASLSAILATLYLLKNAVLKSAEKKLSAVKAEVFKKIPPFYFQKLSLLKIEDLTISRLKPLLMDRLDSLVSLMLDVFLKIVRRLNYDMVYDDGRFEYRRIGNMVHQLTKEDFGNRLARPVQKTRNSQEIRAKSILTGDYETVAGTLLNDIATAASSFGTTLWFTDEDKLADRLKALVITGQATMCYNMVSYLETIIYNPMNGFENLDEQSRNDIESLYRHCSADWSKFKERPSFQYDELAKAPIVGPNTQNSKVP